MAKGKFPFKNMAKMKAAESKETPADEAKESPAYQAMEARMGVEKHPKKKKK